MEPWFSWIMHSKKSKLKWNHMKTSALDPIRKHVNTISWFFLWAWGVLLNSHAIYKHKKTFWIASDKHVGEWPDKRTIFNFTKTIPKKKISAKLEKLSCDFSHTAYINHSVRHGFNIPIQIFFFPLQNGSPKCEKCKRLCITTAPRIIWVCQWKKAPKWVNINRKRHNLMCFRSSI